MKRGAVPTCADGQMEMGAILAEVDVKLPAKNGGSFAVMVKAIPTAIIAACRER
jgi:hypothetical protein